MTEKNWKWYSGSSEEMYEYGPFDTRQEAIDEARSNDIEHVYVMEACKPPLQLSSYIGTHTVEYILEHAEDCVAEFGDEYGQYQTFEVSKDQINDLRDMLAVATIAWQEKHGLTFTTWCFLHTRNEEYINLGGTVQ